MIIYNRFCVEKCGNKEEYYLFDTDMKEFVANNIWTLDDCGHLKMRRKPDIVQSKNTVL